MRFNKQVIAWIVLALVFILAFSFSDNKVVAADNSTNITNTTTNITTNIGNETSLIDTYLEIWDTNFVYVNETVIIYANYSYENGSIVGIEVCTFNQEYMNFNMSSGLYYYYDSYDTAGNYSYEIFCSKQGYLNKTELGIIEVLDLPLNITNTTVDLDLDGYNNNSDCDDNNPNINPGMQEILYNGMDDDCNIDTVDYVVFNVTTNKQVYAHQEIVRISINALNNSDTYITINTPTNVSYVYIFANGTYPAVQEFSLTGLTGPYSIDAINYYEDYTNTKSVNFSVSNSMSINIVTNKDVADTNETIHFRADITGNVGTVNMIWNMDDGNEKYIPEFDYSYNDGRNYNVVLIATDQGGNQVIKTKNIRINPKYNLKVRVIDNKTEEIILNSIVELDNDDKEVNSTGEVEYKVTNRTYNLEVFADGYYVFDENIKINNSFFFTVRLVENPDEIIPTVSIISPANKTETSSSIFKFKFQDNGNSTCTLYVSEGSGWWLDINTSKNLLPDTEYSFNPGLDIGDYKWKIQCRDEDDNLGTSEVYTIIVPEQELVTFAATSSESETVYNVVQNVYDVIPDFSTYSPDEKKIAQYLNMEVLIKDAQRKLEMANRNLFNLNNEPDTQSILDKRDQIYIDIDVIKDATPLLVSVKDKADFVKYPSEEELGQLLDDYLKLKNIELSKSLRKSILEKNNLIQKKVSIRTIAYYVEIQYISGRTEEITLITRTIETDESAQDIMYVEFIPKDLIENTNDIIFITQPDTILNQDPIFEIQLNKIKEFVYYVKKKIELDKIPKIQTTALSVVPDNQNTKITGFAVFDSLGFSESNKNIFLIQMFIVFVLLGVYLFFYFRTNTTFALPRLFNRQKTINEPQKILKKKIVRIPVNEIAMTNQESIDATEKHKIDYMMQVIKKAYSMINVDLEKTALQYHEVKFLYELLSDNDKEIVHEDIINLADKINYKHVQKLTDKAIIELAHNNKDNALEIYENIQTEFEKLPDNYKETLYKKCCEIALHLK